MAARKKKAAETNSVVDKARLDNFEVRDEKTPGGRKAFDIGDEVAEMLRGEDIDGLKKIADKYDLRDKVNEYVRNDLNFGMIRMNLGNMIRARIRAEENGEAPARRTKAKPKAKAKKTVKRGRPRKAELEAEEAA